MPWHRSYPQRFNATDLLLDSHVAGGRGAHPAIRYGDQTITYAELATQVNRMARALARLGVGEGDRVVVRSLNEPPAFVANFAALKLGAVVVPTSPLHDPGQFGRVVSDCTPAVVVVSAHLADAVASSLAGVRTPPPVVVYGAGAEEAGRRGMESYEALVAAEDGSALPAVDRDRESVAVLLYTSGLLEPAMATAHLLEELLIIPDGFGRQGWRVRPDDVICGAGPICFAGGYSTNLTIPFRFGATAAIIPLSTSAEGMFPLIRSYGVTLLAALPTRYREMLYAESADPADLATLRMVSGGGEPLDEETLAGWSKRFNLAVQEGFGTNGMMHVFITAAVADGVRPGSMGLPLPGYQISVRTAEGREAQPGQPGRLHVRGPVGTLFCGHPDAAEAITARQAAVTEDGWTRIGDWVSRDADGHLYFCAREEESDRSGRRVLRPGRCRDPAQRAPAGGRGRGVRGAGSERPAARHRARGPGDRGRLGGAGRGTPAVGRGDPGRGPSWPVRGTYAGRDPHRGHPAAQSLRHPAAPRRVARRAHSRASVTGAAGRAGSAAPAHPHLGGIRMTYASLARRAAPVGALLLLGSVLASGAGGAVASADARTVPVIVRVDHTDPANQQPYPPYNRLYEYTDFFSRSLTVHRGDVLNFQTQPSSFHVVALARDEKAARAAYPAIELDTGDVPAPGSGLPKVVFSDGNFPVTGGSLDGGGDIDKDKPKGPPACGVVQFDQAPCTFRGGDDVEVIGPTVGWDFAQQPATLDQHVRIDAPPGRYTYYDVIHPGSRGTLTVVPDDQPVSTQAQVDADAEQRFRQDREQAVAVEQQLNSLPNGLGRPGDRDFLVYVGAGSPNSGVAIDAMLPNRPINAVAGDRVHFVWADPKSFHSVGFAASLADLPSPFGFDCGGGRYQPVPNMFNQPPPEPCLQPGADEPQFVGDPGNAPSGTALTSPSAVVNSGLLVGGSFHVEPTTRTWSVRITRHTAKGAYHYFDAGRPWMTGVVNVS